MPKEKKEKKEKPLEKMTAKELRELALKIPDITGVHGMNKAELIAEINASRGIVSEKKSEKDMDVRVIKQKIADLKNTREEVRVAGDPKRIDQLRRKISRLKKKTRRA